MHLGARGFVHAELIDPESDVALPLEDGARGELVLTHLRHRSGTPAALSVRAITWRSARVRAHAAARHRAFRCIGRTDDMLIVRGVNVFPTAIREVVGGFAPDVSGHILVKPQAEV